MTAEKKATRPVSAQRSKARPSKAKDEPLKTGSLAPQPTASRSIAASIGAQVRSLRRKLDLTGVELADQAGLSAGMLSKIENGAVSASIESLEALSRALNVPLTTFFASYEEQRDCSYVRAHQGVTIEWRGTKAGHQYQLLGHSISGNIVVEPYLITLTEEAQPYTLFQHAGVEFIYMLTGKVVYRHADKAYLLSPGDALFFDAAGLHGPEELTKLPMTYLSIIIYPRS
ncbi:MAG: helix-turn-helix domain-containing protein [Methyloceanibacter sp.]